MQESYFLNGFNIFIFGLMYKMSWSSSFFSKSLIRTPTTFEIYYWKVLYHGSTAHCMSMVVSMIYFFFYLQLNSSLKLFALYLQFANFVEIYSLKSYDKRSLKMYFQNHENWKHVKIRIFPFHCVLFTLSNYCLLDCR